MGCHIYIHKIKNHEEVEIPFMSCTLFEDLKLYTKKDVEGFLIFQKLSYQNFLNGRYRLRNHFIREMSGIALDGQEEGCEWDYYAKDRILEDLIFRGKRKTDWTEKTNEEILQAIETEIKRAETFQFKEEHVKQILDVFVEGTHYLYTC